MLEENIKLEVTDFVQGGGSIEIDTEMSDTSPNAVENRVIKKYVDDEIADIPAGEDGATFIPSVSAEGIISWTNDKDLPNPESRNIKGPAGDPGDPGTPGKDGSDGFSPVVSTETITGGTRVSIEDSTHTASFDVMNGEDGSAGTPGSDGTDGVSPEVSISTITDGHRVTITDKDHPSGQSFDVMDGTDGTPGAAGSDGTTFTPAVSSAGVISWTNDGGKQNPQSVDIVSAVIAALPIWTGGAY